MNALFAAYFVFADRKHRPSWISWFGRPRSLHRGVAHHEALYTSTDIHGKTRDRGRWPISVGNMSIGYETIDAAAPSAHQ